MKHFYKYLSISIIAMLMATSCSIYEDLYFAENGRIRYELMFDSKELMKTLPKESGKEDIVVQDSTLVIADIIYENRHIEKVLYPEEKEDLVNISPFVVKKHEDSSKNEYTFTISGEFENDIQLNKALFSLNRLMGKTQNDKSEDAISKTKLIDQLKNVSQYKWNGLDMERYTVAADIEKNEKTEEDNIGEIMGVTNPFTSFLMSNKMTVRYHFPVKVDRIDNANAMLSQDGATVIVNYQATVFTESPEDINIKITTIKK